MRGRLDIAVAGCGIGGLAAATLLARDGHRVTIFDRFPRPAAVGSGLLIQPTGRAVLDRLGIAREMEALGERIERLHGVANGRDVLDVDYGLLRSPHNYAIGIHRHALFDCLATTAMTEGVPIRSNCEVTGTEDSSTKSRLLLAGRRSDGPFDLVIDSSGSNSPFAATPPRPLAYGALWATVENLGGAGRPRTLSQRYRQASQMAGLLPLGRLPRQSRQLTALFWSIRADRLESARRSGIERWRHLWVELWPEAAEYADQLNTFDDFTFARYCHRTERRPSSHNLIRIGDSWHSTSPQLGQGANMALLDAYGLAQALRTAESVPDALASAISMRRRHVRLYQLMSLALTPVYQSDSQIIPAIRDRVIGPLSHWSLLGKLQAAAVAGLIGEPLRRLGLE